MVYKLSREELIEQFDDQIHFISVSCKQFDLGDEKEARRIATNLRILLHDTSHSRSLSQQLGLKRKLLFISLASDYSPVNLVTSWQLLTAQMQYNENGASTSFTPQKVNDSPGRNFLLNADDWWNQIIFDDKQYQLSRRDIVLAVANKDGGAHVDDKLSNKFADLVKNNSLGLQTMVGQPLDGNPAYNAIRTIADELLFSLELMRKPLLSYGIYKGHDFDFYYFDESRRCRFLWSNTDRGTSPEVDRVLSAKKSDSRIDVGVKFGTGNRTYEAILPNVQYLKVGHSVISWQ